MAWIKCWLNPLLYVLTGAPALHSFIVRERQDVASVLEFLFHIHDLRKLFLDYCYLGEESTCLLGKIVALFPDLEVLLLEGCFPITSDGYSPISRLKKLSELNLSDCQVDYVCLSTFRDTCCHMWTHVVEHP